MPKKPKFNGKNSLYGENTKRDGMVNCGLNAHRSLSSLHFSQKDKALGTSTH